MATLVSVYHCQMCNARGYLPHTDIEVESWETIAERWTWSARSRPHHCKNHLIGVGQLIGFIFRETSNTDKGDAIQWDVPAPVG